MALANSQAALQWAALDAQFKAGQLDQAALAAALGALLDTWAPSNAALANLISGLSADIQTTLTNLQAIGIHGVVATVGDLPDGASAGDAYLVTANGHGYARINQAWVDIGQFQGSAGTPGRSILLTTGAPAAGVGNDTDVAIDPAAGVLYSKAGGAWTVAGSLLGPAGKIVAVSVTTGAPGTAASVTNAGTQIEADLEFTIPRGDPGLGTVNPSGAIVSGHLAAFSGTDGKTIVDGGATSQFESPANKGVANGYAPLDGSAKVAFANLPASLAGALSYAGVWNASTNTPALASSTGTAGAFYIVSVAGSTALNGFSTWSVGDLVIFSGGAWHKIEGQATDVVSVAGLIGAVSASALKTALAIASGDVSGLGNASTKNVGTTSGTVAAGDDSRITGAPQLAAANTFTAAQTLQTAGTVELRFNNSSGATDQKNVRLAVAGNFVTLQFINDAYSSTSDIFSAFRSGITTTSIGMPVRPSFAGSVAVDVGGGQSIAGTTTVGTITTTATANTPNLSFTTFSNTALLYQNTAGSLSISTNRSGGTQYYFVFGEDGSFSTSGGQIAAGYGYFTGSLYTSNQVTAGAGGNTQNGQLECYDQRANNFPGMAVYKTYASFTGVVGQVGSTKAAGTDFILFAAYSNAFGDLKFYARGDGNCYADGSFSGGGADLAERFEWDEATQALFVAGTLTPEGLPVAFSVGWAAADIDTEVAALIASAPFEKPSADRARKHLVDGGVMVQASDGSWKKRQPNARIRRATWDDDPSEIFGITSLHPNIIGDAGDMRWENQWLRDEWKNPILKPVKTVTWTEQVTKTGVVRPAGAIHHEAETVFHPAEYAITPGAEGEPPTQTLVTPERREVTKEAWDEPYPEETSTQVGDVRTFSFYDDSDPDHADMLPESMIPEDKRALGVSIRVPAGTMVPAADATTTEVVDGVTITTTITAAVHEEQMVRTLNPAFDPSQKYVGRADRPNEWFAIGEVGKLPMRVGQPMNPRWREMGLLAPGIMQILVH